MELKNSLSVSSIINYRIHSYEKIAEIIEKISKSGLGAIIDQLKTVRRVGSLSTIAKEINYSESAFRRLIKKFEKAGLKFTIDINYPAIGFARLFFFIPYIIDYKDVPEKDWLRIYSLSYNPLGTILIYYYPYNSKEFYNIIYDKVCESAPKIDKVLVIIYGKRIQPSFSELFHKSFSREKWSKWIKESYELAKENGDLERKIYIQKPKFHDPYDIIDLIILKEMEHNAFTPLIKLVEKYPFPLRVFTRHLATHVEKKEMINGIFLKTNFVSALTDTVHIVLFTVTDAGRAALLYKYLRDKPWIYFIGWGRSDKNYTIMASVVIPSFLNSFLAKVFQALRNSGLVDEINIFTYDLSSVRKRGIPYRNYDQQERSWTLDTIESEKVLQRRIFRQIKRDKY